MKKAGFETRNKAGLETIGPLLPSCFLVASVSTSHSNAVAKEPTCYLKLRNGQGGCWILLLLKQVLTKEATKTPPCK